jgi:hypothetical protein
MSAVRSLSGDKRTYRGHRISVAIDPGCVETPFIPQKLQRIGVVHVDVTA